MTNKSEPKPHVPATDPKWLALSKEEPLAVNYPVTDAHFHMWDYSDPPYFGDAYAVDARAAGIETTIYVECSMGYRTVGPVAERPTGEVEFAQDQSKSHSQSDCKIAAGIVGMADISLGRKVAPILEQQIKAGDGRFRGIRVRAAYDADEAVGYGANGAPAHVLAQPSTRAALEVLRDLGLSLDVYAFHTQLAEVADLARAMPDLPIVLNHFGAPIGVGQYADTPDQVFADWQKGISALAPFDNLSIKIGGFAISRIAIVERGDRQAPLTSKELAEDFRPWAEHCFATFGPDRCMFGSNFPVDKNAMSMTNCVNAMKRLAAELDPADEAKFMNDNAIRFYRI